MPPLSYTVNLSEFDHRTFNQAVSPIPSETNCCRCFYRSNSKDQSRGLKICAICEICGFSILCRTNAPPIMHSTNLIGIPEIRGNPPFALTLRLFLDYTNSLNLIEGKE